MYTNGVGQNIFLGQGLRYPCSASRMLGGIVRASVHRSLWLLSDPKTPRPQDPQGPSY